MSRGLSAPNLCVVDLGDQRVIPSNCSMGLLFAKVADHVTVFFNCSDVESPAVILQGSIVSVLNVAPPPLQACPQFLHVYLPVLNQLGLYGFSARTSIFACFLCVYTYTCPSFKDLRTRSNAETNGHKNRVFRELVLAKTRFLLSV